MVKKSFVGAIRFVFPQDLQHRQRHSHIHTRGLHRDQVVPPTRVELQSDEIPPGTTTSHFTLHTSHFTLHASRFALHCFIPSLPKVLLPTLFAHLLPMLTPLRNENFFFKISKLRTTWSSNLPYFTRRYILSIHLQQPSLNIFRTRSLKLLSSYPRYNLSFLPNKFSARSVAKMSEITHPTIQDGWFREISNMWPGQAMTLKVKKVLHHEKSKYQDVLVFESTDYGTVLVLDNVIQATERDEFSYQEMIAHLALNSHPNPKKVLVIGGGDGGVLREVVKHESVEEAILCDIDEAVIRLSKKYLPDMSVSYQHPKVKTHIGDGFKFLDDYKNEFDVIITDSSDPEGPAESLFQKPYFELLHGALREGGVITTQAENQWIHLPMITKLKKDCKEVFPNVEYAYTTIPTYPSGQIGFMVCCKDANRDLRKPLRKWSPEEEEKLCRYYNAAIHEASFVLPTFARVALK
ncbi:hypothetical protein EYC80_011030 [Monilinia laxa]|uniref:PABS domain-containing protein n=1 Tax=Monilinia laxa TaxID=61186 RepID=A0A5N6JQ83_MONLA|nr:hypothetical protein EYC80_011030 [Monilinia laxa]